MNWVGTAAAAASVSIVFPLAAAAQDGLRSASLPERGFESTSADGRDLFRVPADFYNRPPDADSSRLFVPHPLPTFVWGPYWPVTSVRGFTGAQVRRFRFTGSRCSDAWVPGSQVHGCSGAPVTEGSEIVPEAAASPTVITPLTPGKPKTFYVIPGCYAGDRPPELEWLPTGCDISKMRVVTPTPVPSSLLRKGV